MNYTITVTAQDPNPNSDHGNTSFSLDIIPNEIPEFDTGLHVVPVNMTVHYQFAYTVPSDAFKDKEGDDITVVFSLIPDEFVMTYDNTTRVVSGTLDDNTKFGNYTMHFDVTDIWNVSTLVAELNFTYFENMPPVVGTQPSDPASIIAHFPLSYSIPKSYFSEPESETIIYSFSTNETNVRYDWLSMRDNSTHLIFSGTPNNTQFGIFKVTISLDDGHDDVSNTTTEFNINVTENRSPVITSTPTPIEDGQVGFNWSYVFDQSWVTEHENEPVTTICSFSPSDAWLSCTINSTHVTFSGFPDNNIYAKQYTITINILDPHPDVNDINWSSSFIITANDPPVIGTVTDQSLLAPDGLTWSFGASLTSDPENLTYNRSLEFDGLSIAPDWLVYDLSQFNFAIISSSNSIRGTYNITIIVVDDYNTPVKSSFLLTIIGNTSPQIVKFIQNQAIVNFNYLFVQFLPVDELFTDPDNRTMRASMLQTNGNPLPSFLAYNQIDNTMFGTPELVHVGDYLLSYIATDDHNQTTNITFTLTVKPCYFK